MQLKPALLIFVVICCSCKGASIDGLAQEEHYKNTDYMHTSFPAESARSSDARTEEDKSLKIEETRSGSADTTTNPL